MISDNLTTIRKHGWKVSVHSFCAADNGEAMWTCELEKFTDHNRRSTVNSYGRDLSKVIDDAVASASQSHHSCSGAFSSASERSGTSIVHHRRVHHLGAWEHDDYYDQFHPDYRNEQKRN